MNTKKIKVVCMGDSITEGFGIEDSSKNYPSMLQTFLGDRFRVYNMGHSGSCVTNTELDGRPVGVPYIREAEYAESLNLKGDIYVIMLGTNDAQDGMHDTEDIQNPYDNNILYEADFEKYYEQILSGVRQAAPRAALYLCKPAPVLNCIWRTHQEKYLLRLLPHYDHLAKVRPDLILVDVHAAFTALPPEELQSCYQADNLHLNEKGAALAARIIADAVLTDLA